MDEHVGLDHKGVMRACINEVHFCWGSEDGFVYERAWIERGKMMAGAVLRTPSRRTQESLPPMPRYPTTLARLEAKTDKQADGCWLWRGRVDACGYGRITHEGQEQSVHAAGYEILVGPVPLGLELDHICRTRSCWKPEHLEPVTHKINSLRSLTAPPALNAIKQRCHQGHPYDEQNTIVRVRKNGAERRDCRICANARNRKRWPQVKAKREAARYR